MKNNKTKAVVGAYLSTNKQTNKKGGLYNTFHELLSEKWIVKRSRFHASYIISRQYVTISATSHLVGCITLENKVDKSAVATSYQVGWIHSKTSLVGNSDNINYKTQKPCYENPSLKSTDLCRISRFSKS